MSAYGVFNQQIGNYVPLDYYKSTGDYCLWYTARDVRTQEIVDLKIFIKSQIKEYTDVDTFYSKVTNLQKLDNDSIIPIIKILQSDDYIFVVQERLPNGSLADYIKRSGRKFKQNTLIRWTKQILEGLSAIHSVGLAMNDVRLENIGLDIESRIRIIDFGISQRALPIVVDDPKCSPLFLAPEVIKDDFAAGNKADMWTFGIIIHYLVTGHYPFDFSNMKNYYENIDNPIFYYIKCTGSFGELTSLLLHINPIMRCTADELLKSHIFKETPARKGIVPICVKKQQSKAFLPLNMAKTPSRINLTGHSKFSRMLTPF